MYKTFYKFILCFFIAIFVIRFGMSELAKSNKYNGFGFTLRIPDGWEKISDIKKDRDNRKVIFGTVEKNQLTGRPVAFISILSSQMEQVLWIEDEFPKVIRSLAKAQLKILKKGDIKIDKQIAKWVLYDDIKADLVNLEMYMITDSKLFVRLTFAGDPINFNKRRTEFEKLKESFKFKFLF